MDSSWGRDIPIPRVFHRWNHTLPDNHRYTLRYPGHQIVHSSTFPIWQRDYTQQADSRHFVYPNEHSLDTLWGDLHRSHTSNIWDSVCHYDYRDTICKATHEIGGTFADSLWVYVSIRE